MEEIKLNHKQSKFIDKLREGRNIELLGVGGTGKTFTLTEGLKDIKGAVKVCPTGISAILAGGSTMHSYFMLPFPFDYAEFVRMPEEDKESYFDTKQGGKKYYKRINKLIFDEISMISPAMFDYIDSLMRYNNNSDKPFAGVQVILVGDYEQLQPIIKDEEYKSYEKTYGLHGRYNITISDVYKKLNLQRITLTQIIRQSDKEYIKKIMEVRNTGIVNYEQFKEFELKSWDGLDEHIVISTYRRMVDGINDNSYGRIKGNEIKFKGKVEGRFSERDAGQLVPMIVKVKKGMRAILKRNLKLIPIGDNKTETYFYNGDLGTVIDIYGDHIEMKVDRTGDIIKIYSTTWDKIKYDNQGNESLIGSYTQLPIKIGYALTIHSLQGMSIDKAIFYPYTGKVTKSFGAGLNYVGLSRITDIKGLKIKFE